MGRVKLFVRGASGRQRFHVRGAINASTHELISVTNHTDITAETMCELLRKVAAAGRTTPLTLVLDNAAYQRCQWVRVSAQQWGIERLCLPSYSPHLNLLERLWKFVQQQALHSRHHTRDADFHAAIETCLDELSTTHQPALDSLITLHFQTVENVPLLPA